MKLLVFITDDSHAEPAIDALVEQGFRVTRLATTGGFLRRGNTTLLAGVEDHQASHALAVVQRVATGALSFTLELERCERL